MTKRKNSEKYVMHKNIEVTINNTFQNIAFSFTTRCRFKNIRKFDVYWIGESEQSHRISSRKQYDFPEKSSKTCLINAVYFYFLEHATALCLSFAIKTFEYTFYFTFIALFREYRIQPFLLF